MKNGFLGIRFFIKKINVTNIDIYILYIAEISDKDSISTNLIKPLLQYNKNETLTIETIANSIIYIDTISMDNNKNIIIDYILKDNALIFIPYEEKYIIADIFNISFTICCGCRLSFLYFATPLYYGFS